MNVKAVGNSWLHEAEVEEFNLQPYYKIRFPSMENSNRKVNEVKAL